MSRAQSKCHCLAVCPGKAFNTLLSICLSLPGVLAVLALPQEIPLPGSLSNALSSEPCPPFEPAHPIATG